VVLVDDSREQVRAHKVPEHQTMHIISFLLLFYAEVAGAFLAGLPVLVCDAFQDFDFVDLLLVELGKGLVLLDQFLVIGFGRGILLLLVLDFQVCGLKEGLGGCEEA